MIILNKYTLSNNSGGGKIEFIDGLKGWLIILVVFAHSLQYSFGADYTNQGLFFDDYLFRYINSFHMPLFMFISGYLFCFSNKKNFSRIFRKKLIRIGIPYIAYSLCIYILNTLVSRHINLSVGDIICGYLMNIWLKWNMWYFLSLLINMTIISMITHICSKQSICNLLFILLFFVALIIPDEWMMSILKYMFTFFIFGYWANQYHLVDFIKLERTMNRKILLSSLLLIVLITFVGLTYGRNIFINNSGYSISLSSSSWRNIMVTDLVRYVYAIIVGGLSVVLCKKFIHNSLMRLLGNNTLGIYGIQCIVYVLLFKFYSLTGIHLEHSYIIAIAVTLVVLLTSLTTIRFFRKYKMLSFIFLGQ